MLRLSRLPRAHTSLNVRYTAPGHANPYFLDRSRFIDPAHPAARLNHRNLPAFVCPQFTIRAFPNAILHQPVDFVPVNPLLATGLARARACPHARRKWWSNLKVDENEGHKGSEDINSAVRQRDQYTAARQLADARIAALAQRGRLNVSLLFHTSKKATSKSCVVRRRLRSKMTAAIGLVVARSADAVPVSESDKSRPPTPYPPLRLVSGALQDSEPLVVQGWTFLVMPGLGIYKTPLPNLVQVVRQAFVSLSRQSRRLEATWVAMPRRESRSPLNPPVDLQLRHPHAGVVDKSESLIRAQPQYPRKSKRTLGSKSPTESAPKQRVSTRLYSVKPIILPHGKPKNQK